MTDKLTEAKRVFDEAGIEYRNLPYKALGISKFTYYPHEGRWVLNDLYFTRLGSGGPAAFITWYKARQAGEGEKVDVPVKLDEAEARLTQIESGLDEVESYLVAAELAIGHVRKRLYGEQSTERNNDGEE